MSLEERFWKKVDKNGPIPAGRPDLGPCWVWTAFTDKAGYGRIKEGGRTTPVLYGHRVAYEFLVGPIPPRLHLDHLCRVRHCVNPAHLEPVTCRENMMRGVNPKAVAHLAGTCTNGHPRNGPDAYQRKDRPGRWNCNACQRERRRAA